MLRLGVHRALAAAFDSGRSVAEIARAFGRTEGSLASRLVRIGKVADRQAARAFQELCTTDSRPA